MDESKHADQRLLDEIRDLRERLAALKRSEADSRKSEANLEARAIRWTTLSAIGQSALSGKDLTPLLDEAAARIAQTLDVPYCIVLELLPDGEALLVRAAAGLPRDSVGRATVPARAGSMAGFILLAAEPVVFEDLREERRFQNGPLPHERDVRSGIGVVLRGRDRPFGVLCVQSAERRVFSRVDVDFLESVATVLATAIDRKRAEEALGSSHDRYRLLFDKNPHPMWLYDSETLRYLAVNEAAIRQYGWSREEFLSMTLKDIRPPEDVPLLMKGLEQVGQGLYSPPGVWRHRRKDGSIFEVEVTLQSPLDLAGRPVRLAMAVDVTERRRAEKALRDSETRYRLVSRASNEAIWDWDLRTDKVVWNEGVKTLFGFPVEQVGADAAWWIEGIHPEDREGVMTSVQAVLDSGQTFWKGEYRFRKFDGAYAPVFDSGYVVHGEDKRPARMVGSMMDLSGMKRAEAALAAEKEQLAVTLRSIGDAVITTDTEGKVLLMNPIAEELTGWTQQEASGRPFAQIARMVDERTGQPHRDPVSEILRADGPVSLPADTMLIARGGQARRITDSGAPIRDQSGKALGVVLVLRDVTEKRRIEEEMLKASKLESVGVLAGGIAHDFNNILTAVLGNILLIKMSLRPEDAATARLIEAESACLRAKDLTKQLLTFSKGGDPMKIRTAIGSLARESADLALRGSKVRCEADLPEDLWPVEIDRGQMRQVIHNLVTNAIQAMPDGGTVHIRGENVTVAGDGRSYGGARLPPGRYVRLSIADEGPGVPAAIRDRIFDPYFTTRPMGSGLGLAIVYSVITKHEGTIGVESRDGVGAVFHLMLPAGAPPDPQARVDVERARPAPREGRILVMDDEESIKRVTGEMLRRNGCLADFAADGSEAISLVERARAAGRPYAAVILDLTIPGGMGGKETILKLRALDPDVRAIVFSGYSNDPVLGDYRRHGFSGMIAKPFTFEDLNAALESALQRRR